MRRTEGRTVCLSGATIIFCDGARAQNFGLPSADAPPLHNAAAAGDLATVMISSRRAKD